LLCRDLLGEGGGEGGIELGSWEVRLIQLLRRASWKQGKNSVAQKEKRRKERSTVEVFRFFYELTEVILTD